MFSDRSQFIKKQWGQSFIELMIAFTIALSLTSLILKIYVSGQASYQLQSSLLMISHHARSALNILNREIKASGYMGCARLTSAFPMMSHVSETLTAENQLTLTSNSIEVRHAALKDTYLLEDMRESTRLRIPKNMHVNAKDILIISNCAQAEIFSVKKTFNTEDSQYILPVSPLNNLYAKGAYVSHLEVNQYFVNKTNRKDDHGNIIYALYMKDIKQHKFELVDNIEAMRVSSLITDMSKPNGVRVELDLSSPVFKKTWSLYAAT